MKKTINKLFIGVISLFLSAISISGCSILDHKHSFLDGKTTKEATCTSDGEITYSCKDGDFEYKEIIPSLGHSYKRTILKEATCTEDGAGYDKCERCDDVVNITIKALGHDYSVLKTQKVEATCTKAGKEAIYQCSRCSSTKGGETIKALGHDMGEYEVTLEATCGKDGLKTSKCKRCDHSITEIIPLTNNHSWTIEGNNGICSICSTPYFTKGLSFTKAGSTYQVSSYNGNSTTIIIPSTYLGIKVTSIKSDLFKSNTVINNVTIGDNITSIPSYCFYNCTNLVYIDLNNVTEVGNYAFYNTNKLTTINKGNLTKVGDRSFYNSNLLTSLDLSNVTSLGKEAFKDCKALKDIYLSTQLTTISEGCFENNTSLTSITIPSSVIKIEKYAFKDSGLTSATFLNINNWKLDDSENAIDEETMANTSMMATYLKEEAVNYVWTRS